MPHVTAPPAGAPITEAEARGLQSKCASAAVGCSATYAKKGDCAEAAPDAAVELYGYDHVEVLFKPTQVTANPFRSVGEDAVPTFAGAEAAKDPTWSCEDTGFALNGDNGWANAVSATIISR